MRAEDVLPYRKPWVLIDTIVQCSEADGVVARKHVSSSDFYVLGHFPGYSIYPGMLLLEGIVQASGLLMERGIAEGGGRRDMKARFLQPVRPGDTVTYAVKRIREDRRSVVFAAEGTVDGRKVVRAFVEFGKGGEAD
ncbi:3-hydroxyacyl-[acyl-carrier-protein] dehydratase FabZ [Paenibacillus tyrfis]|uniref:3-hydroxyacyl-ACP dehydratase FabZ family protein n=1 Tax=Paenibacillus tyrfis TaxID=1501230 RepID=UPI00248F78D8|nr:3-hydroxyacyl-ACP dehydratase FabZ family protein [Paenibacillus tyrfis]GLI08263.1 3-hydroxyacyl-[acyl-carrier-protein] dehydratase FabZ [Paenibacillus tyrfis]